jgi:hypothetical protein
MEELATNFHMMASADPPDNKPRPEERKRAIAILKRAYIHSSMLGLPVSKALLSKAADDPPETGREFKQLIGAIEEEIKSKLFLFVPTHNAEYYEKDISVDGFPLASAELRRASNCYALSEPTACVFHCMRAVEMALRALAKSLAVVVPVNTSQWQTLIEQIEIAVKGISQQPKSSQKSEDQTFYSEAAAQFRYTKDAWRNHVAHARVTYDESQALKIFEHSADMLRSLAPRLQEPV